MYVMAAGPSSVCASPKLATQNSKKSTAPILFGPGKDHGTRLAPNRRRLTNAIDVFGIGVPEAVRAVIAAIIEEDSLRI
jgi:hypothetical protein